MEEGRITTVAELMTEEWKRIQYENTTEFREYLAERERWMDARDNALRYNTPVYRYEEFDRYERMAACLEEARRTPEHKAAFGF